MKYHKKDLTKDHLTLEETHTLASNLNRIEIAREIQKEYTEIDAVFGLLGGIMIIPLGIWMTIEMLVCADNILQMIFELFVVFVVLSVDIWYIRANWNWLIGKM